MHDATLLLQLTSIVGSTIGIWIVVCCGDFLLALLCFGRLIRMEIENLWLGRF
jgi:hypothetical protein